MRAEYSPAESEMRAVIFAEDSWEREVIAICMKLYKENPTDWRRSIVLAEDLCTRRNYHYYSRPSTVNEQIRCLPPQAALPCRR